MSTAVITIVAGRHQHLRRQQWALSVQTAPPDFVVVVGMDDAEAAEFTAAGPLPGKRSQIISLNEPVRAEGLPLAAARNAGARAALERGAQTLIFLDVDCIPHTGLVERYTAATTAEHQAVLHCGEVQYLDEDSARLPVTAFAPDLLSGRAHPARPVPNEGSQDSDLWEMFWSLSFAVSAGTWALVGGFDEQFVGYGGEDTDFGYRAHRAGIPLRWWSHAQAFHQYHPSRQPPVAHLADIVRNANLFGDRHGFFPMRGWLDAFADLGLAGYDRTTGHWQVITAAGQSS